MASLFMSRVAIVKMASAEVIVWTQCAAATEFTLADFPGLYATDMKSLFSPRAGSRSAGSPPRGGEKSQTKIARSDAWAYVATTDVIGLASASKEVPGFAVHRQGPDTAVRRAEAYPRT